ncbi:hypothetical protein SCLCIDRAFT_133797 [Scleroderma citrinum Foug A]|uniref:AAA+ ATPase domain-containing protein n=1 Tax=Scleroderma citrinum Foug A TaxID=1036808 RepID=A0A0C3DHP2_9AGAM|nr:hypothetical protein SCLCIDRAFT_133797 [Scleroderma citrinum Foug A]
MRRSCVVLGRTRSLLVTSRQRAHGNARLVIPTRLARTKVPRDTHSDPNGPARQSSGVQTRSSIPPKSAQDAEQSPIQLDADSPPHPDDSPPIPPPEPEKPPRRTRTSASSTSDTSTQRDRESDPDDRPQLPQGLDILWLPQDLPSSDSQRNNILPPPELFDDALTNLHIALHPHTQHRAAYVTSTGLPTEPTLALYCPVEGGEYVLDETVRELARRTGAEVLVIDAVQLAAGEWGQFGKGKRLSYEDDTDVSSYVPSLGIAQMTLHVLAPAIASRGRQPPLFTTSRTAPPPNRVKAFFDDLVNIPSPDAPGQRPRLVYIRDFPTLAPTAPTWYPHLLSAVRARRTGPMARPSSPIACPMAIICGVTPSLVAQGSFSVSSPSSSYPLSGSQVLPLGRGRPAARPSPAAALGTSTNGTSLPLSEWGEDEHSTLARERRLRERLRRWECGGDVALLEDVPHLLTANSVGPSAPPPSPTFGPSYSPASSSSPFTPFDLMGGEGEGGDGSSASAAGSVVPGKFFRAAVVLPSSRDVGAERQCRMARRREMNELAMRMGVGGVGGSDANPDSDVSVQSPESDSEAESSNTPNRVPEEHEMWTDWSTRIESWLSIRQIADRAVGSVVASQSSLSALSTPGLGLTEVPWSAIHRAWAAQRSGPDLRKAWMKDARVRIVRGPQHEHGVEEDGDDVDWEGEEGQGRYVDEVVEAVKQDKDLDPHEERLLGCIVDPASLSTTFAQVHLPQHTIDSVRTLVSLPLLYPAAFQMGILREHAMTGCLLFGPPGTGKTLIVRALAKEAGSRMLMVSPSDVMDMYVGEGEKLVRAVFSLARRLSPCVVFLDEIDALFGARTSAHNSGGVIAHRGVITEFMQEMDGLKSRTGEDRVIVIGATNRPFDLDDAVLRRLPRRLLVDLPGEKEREGILRILLRDETLSPDIDLASLAKRTESFSGSDLKHLCVSAALAAVKEGVNLPWDAPSDQAASPITLDTTPPLTNSRIIHPRHFTRALKEITPSSSETLGSLADLRKWNEQFGEGRQDKRRVQVWGKGRFGFTDATVEVGQDEGRVAEHQAKSSIEQ